MSISNLWLKACCKFAAKVTANEEQRVRCNAVVAVINNNALDNASKDAELSALLVNLTLKASDAFSAASADAIVEDSITDVVAAMEEAIAVDNTAIDIDTTMSLVVDAMNEYNVLVASETDTLLKEVCNGLAPTKTAKDKALSMVIAKHVAEAESISKGFMQVFQACIDQQYGDVEGAHRMLTRLQNAKTAHGAVCIVMNEYVKSKA